MNCNAQCSLMCTALYVHLVFLSYLSICTCPSCLSVPVLVYLYLSFLSIFICPSCLSVPVILCICTCPSCLSVPVLLVLPRGQLLRPVPHLLQQLVELVIGQPATSKPVMIWRILPDTSKPSLLIYIIKKNYSSLKKSNIIMPSE